MNALEARCRQMQAEFAGMAEVEPIGLHPFMAETCRVRVPALIAGLMDKDGASGLGTREPIRALVEPIVRTPPVGGPTEITLHLEGPWQRLDHKGQQPAEVSASKKAALSGDGFLGTSLLVAGAGYGHSLQLARSYDLRPGRPLGR